jgi:hypothetical protein
MAETAERGNDRGLARRNVRVGLLVLAAILVLALLPATCRMLVEPDAHHPTAADARAAGAPLPAFVPGTARNLYERHGDGRRFVRFALDSAAATAATAGMRRLPVEEVERLTLPTPGWSKWWPITSKTLSGSQGKILHVYAVASPPADRGYVAVDPRTWTAYYWSTPAR